VPAFTAGRVAGAVAPGVLEISYGFQQSQIVMLASHQDGTKQDGRCNHATWSSGPLSRGCSQGRTCIGNLSWGILVTWLKQGCQMAGISLLIC